MRFDDGSEEAYEIMHAVRERHFPELAGCNIKIIFDSKKRMTGGKIVLGSIQKPNELTRFFMIPESGTDEGFDYVVRLDKKCWDLIDPEDKKRLMRHELKHTSVDFDATTPYKIRGHTIEDFYSEITLNEDDPRWAERAAQSTLAAYEQERE
jgi:hypothetical protein